MKQYVELNFTSLEPKQVAALVSIEPTECHAAGDERIPGAAWRRSHWTLRSKTPENEIDASVHFEDLIAQLKPHLEDLKKVAKLATPTVSWVVRVFADGQSPNGVIPPEALRTICELGAVLNVSLYFDRQRLG